MGSTFATPATNGNSSIGREQSQLHSKLADYYFSQLSSGGNAADEIDSILRGEDRFVNETAKTIFEGSILGPSIREFEQVTRPQINNNFAGIGGILSTRRNQVLADTKGAVIGGAQQQLAALIPQLMQLRLGGIQARESLRFQNADLASQFALAQTKQVSNQQAGPGFGLVGTALGAGAGFLIGGPVGGVIGAGLGSSLGR